jgi:hypothetical protein
MNPTLAILVAASATVASGTTTPAQREPACTATEYRQFDFWLGRWRVTDTTGKQVGRNHIERSLGGCVLHESWTATDGSKGESFNIYDRSSGRWHQTWVDEHGLLLQLDGGLQGPSMVLEGERLSPDHTRMLHRITWTPLDAQHVRQHWERSADGGKTWETLFDGRYARTRDQNR